MNKSGMDYDKSLFASNTPKYTSIVRRQIIGNKLLLANTGGNASLSPSALCEHSNNGINYSSSSVLKLSELLFFKNQKKTEATVDTEMNDALNQIKCKLNNLRNRNDLFICKSNWTKYVHDENNSKDLNGEEGVRASSSSSCSSTFYTNSSFISTINMENPTKVFKTTTAATEIMSQKHKQQLSKIDLNNSSPSVDYSFKSWRNQAVGTATAIDCKKGSY